MATVPGALVAQLRRLTAEPIDTSPYSDVDLIEAIERYPLPDAAGAAPDDTAWTGAWDIYQAAADICDEKPPPLPPTSTSPPTVATTSAARPTPNWPSWHAAIVPAVAPAP